MDPASDFLVPVESANPAMTLPGRRLHHRQRLSTLAYINLDRSNGGIIRDISEAGVAIQTVTPLRLSQQVALQFDLLRPRLHVEALGRVAWEDAHGQAGVQFLNVDDRSRRSLKQWIFTQILARAQQLADSGFVFAPGDPGEAVDQLLFSAPPRPAIRLETKVSREPIGSRQQTLPTEGSQPRTERGYETLDRGNSAPIVRLPWVPFPIPQRVLANLVDGLILISALLLFCVLAMGVTQMLPSWPVAAALALIVSAVFAALYRVLFVIWMGATPGARLAQLAGSDSGGNEGEVDREPFR